LWAHSKVEQKAVRLVAQWAVQSVVLKAVHWADYSVEK
jgi:hypothetical protein